MSRCVYILYLALFVIFACGSEEERSSLDSRGLPDVQSAQDVDSEDRQTGMGTITGQVIFEGLPPKPQTLLVVKDVAVCGKKQHYDERLVVSKGGGIRNAVVCLKGVTGCKPLSSLGEQFILDQTGCVYRPHVMLLPVRTPVSILNNDGILHNIHTFSRDNASLNIAQPKFRKRLELTFENPERIQVKCDIHGWMSSWIIVIDHPYYSITDEAGRFSLSDVPPGTYTLSCWQEFLGEQSTTVTIEPGGSISQDFHFAPEH